jgi:hypothetical protein
MRSRTACMMMVCFVLACGAASGEVRVYRQFKDVAVRENGKVIQSADAKNLFECTYDVNMKNNTITRTKIRRLDDPVGRKDDDVYAIKEKRRLWPSESGNGGSVLVAVEKDGHEILEMGHRFAFTTRTSPFSQVISGVYKRVYDKDHVSKWHKDKK